MIGYFLLEKYENRPFLSLTSGPPYDILLIFFQLIIIRTDPMHKPLPIYL